MLNTSTVARSLTMADTNTQVTITSVTKNQGHNIWPHVNSIRHEQQWPKHLPQKIKLALTSAILQTQ